MAEQPEQIVIDIDAHKATDRLNELNANLEQLTANQKAIQQEMKKTGANTSSLTDAYVKNAKQISLLKGEQKTLIAQLQTNEKANFALGTSYNELSAQLTQLQKEYKGLTAEQRDSSGGQALLKQIADTKQALKDIDATMGDYQRNVGDYKNAIVDAGKELGLVRRQVMDMGNTLGAQVPIFGKLNTAMKSMGAGFGDFATKGTSAMSGIGASLKTFGKLFITPPIAIVTAIVGAIVLVVKQLKEAFERNKAASDAMKRALGALKPIGDAIKAVFDAIVNVIAKMIGWVTKAMSWIGLSTDTVDEATRAQNDYTRAIKATERAYARLSFRQQQLQTQLEQSKQLETELKRAADDTTRSYEQRLDAVETLGEVQIENAEKELKIAQDTEKAAKKAFETYASQHKEFITLTKDGTYKIKAVAGTVSDTYTEAVGKLQEYETAITNTAKAENNLADVTYNAEMAVANLREEQANKRKERAAKQLEVQKELDKLAEDYTLSLIKDEGEKAVAQRAIQGQREIDELRRKFEQESILTNEQREQLNDIIRQKEEQLQIELDAIRQDALDRKSQRVYEQEQQDADRLLRIYKDMLQNKTEDEVEQQNAAFEQRLAAELEQTILTEEQKTALMQYYQEERGNIEAEYWEGMKKQAEDARAFYAEKMKGIGASAVSTFSAMSNLLGQYAEDNEDAARASKAFGILALITDQAMAIGDTARAITAAVAGAANAAAAGGPLAPILIAAYTASMVGSVVGAIGGVVSTIAQAKQLLSSANPQFAEGGIVDGNSYTGDKIQANVNSREMVLTLEQQKELFDIANRRSNAGGIDYEALAVAVSNTPAPILDYQEFNAFKAKVVQYDELAKL